MTLLQVQEHLRRRTPAVPTEAVLADVSPTDLADCTSGAEFGDADLTIGWSAAATAVPAAATCALPLLRSALVIDKAVANLTRA